MALEIATYDNATGPSVFFKAVGHPLAAPLVRALLERAGRQGPVAVYDPDGTAPELFALHPARGWVPAAYLVQRLEHLGRALLGVPAQPVSALPATAARTVLLCTFDADDRAAEIRDLLPEGADLVTLDAARLPEAMLSDRRHYLAPLNFATNLALFRDDGTLTSRLVTLNYWAGYGAPAPALWFRLFDADGAELATWREDLGPEARSVVVDSRAVRARFGLPAFAGSLFVHAQGIAGHDTIKYALDVDDGPAISGTHDANAFPAELYAGLPAPDRGERVLLWLQNAHPVAVPAGAIAARPMGGDGWVPFDEAIPPFGTRALDVGALLPRLAWPRQVEVRAGRHVVRPRYEVIATGIRAIAHANVERTDLRPDDGWARQAGAIGKGPLVVAPVLPRATWRTEVLPTPMATGQEALPLILRAYATDGREIACHPLGTLARDHESVTAIDDLAPEADGGHLELAYDLAAGVAVDGWLHAIVRYRRRDGQGLMDTSFGAHLFNLPVTYRGEPQSYAGRPPGLSTRLYLRLGGEEASDTVCHLIYPASAPWRERSATTLSLIDAAGRPVAQDRVAIPCNGSLRWSVAEAFERRHLDAARGGAVLVRDATCRLFGYHHRVTAAGEGGLDHLFGF